MLREVAKVHSDAIVYGNLQQLADAIRNKVF
jgi:hypothetical protein